MRSLAPLLAALTLTVLSPHALPAQWQLQESHTTADLRGVAYLGGGVAWASGTNGTIIRTEDSGFVWQGCAVPPDASTLDFRAIVGFDEHSAIVMSAGTGSKSRLYRTDDNCLTWRLLKTNTDREGFWDALRFTDRQHGMLLGDPVDGRFVLLQTADGGANWTSLPGEPADRAKDQGAFAASNSALLLNSAREWSFCTGGIAGPHVWQGRTEFVSSGARPGSAPIASAKSSEELPVEEKAESAGCFSLAQREGPGPIIAVGGDYKHPEAATGNAWTSAPAALDHSHPDFHFGQAQTGPAGFRSAVDWNAEIKAWVAAGPTGTDTSTDDGLHWNPLPGSTAQGWNALSGPFAVGPKGRVGRLRTDVLQHRPASY